MMIQKDSFRKREQTTVKVRNDDQAGQSIVIIAFALIGILAFVGIAVDVGLVFARSTQLQAAVDSAALAGVVELVNDNVNNANRKAEQFFNTNGFNLTVTTGGSQATGRALPPSELGALQYELSADWPVELYFLKLIGRDAITLTRRAVAGVFPQADIYASRRIEDGVLSTSNQAVFGLNSCTHMGDPFSPVNSPWAAGQYTYNYRILIPPDYPQDIVRVELFDPDSINQPGSNFTVNRTQLAVDNGLPLFADLTCPTTNNYHMQYQPCLIPTGEMGLGLPLDAINPFWFIRIDENRRARTGVNSGCGSPPGNNYNAALNTRTTFELFYYAQNEDRTVRRIPLAVYTGQVGDGVRDNGDHLTDMQWVAPGGQMSLGQPAPVPTDCGSPNGGDYHPTNCPGGTPIGPGKGFEISISQSLGSIMTDPATGNRFIYLNVTAIDGSSENGFEVWAGPNTYVNDINSDANVRNLQALNSRGSHSSKGVTVFGMGRLPMNSNVDFRVDVPLIWVGPEMAGQSIYISMFDSDSEAEPPLYFYFDSIAFNPATGAGDWFIVINDPDPVPGRCVVGNCNDQWTSPPYEIVVPGDIENCDYNNPTPSCIPFYGGRLVANYVGGNADTYGWQVRSSGLPYLIE